MATEYTYLNLLLKSDHHWKKDGVPNLPLEHNGMLIDLFNEQYCDENHTLFVPTPLNGSVNELTLEQFVKLLEMKNKEEDEVLGYLDDFAKMLIQNWESGTLFSKMKTNEFIKQHYDLGIQLAQCADRSDKQNHLAIVIGFIPKSDAPSEFQQAGMTEIAVIYLANPENQVTLKLNNCLFKKSYGIHHDCYLIWSQALNDFDEKTAPKNINQLSQTGSDFKVIYEAIRQSQSVGNGETKSILNHARDALFQHIQHLANNVRQNPNEQEAQHAFLNLLYTLSDEEKVFFTEQKQSDENDFHFNYGSKTFGLKINDRYTKSMSSNSLFKVVCNENAIQTNPNNSHIIQVQFEIQPNNQNETLLSLIFDKLFYPLSENTQQLKTPFLHLCNVQNFQVDVQIILISDQETEMVYTYMGVYHNKNNLNGLRFFKEDLFDNCFLHNSAFVQQLLNHNVILGKEQWYKDISKLLQRLFIYGHHVNGARPYAQQLTDEYIIRLKEREKNMIAAIEFMEAGDDEYHLRPRDWFDYGNSHLIDLITAIKQFVSQLGLTRLLDELIVLECVKSVNETAEPNTNANNQEQRIWIPIKQLSHNKLNNNLIKASSLRFEIIESRGQICAIIDLQHQNYMGDQHELSEDLVAMLETYQQIGLYQLPNN